MSSIRHLAKFAAVPALFVFALGCADTVRVQGVVTNALNGEFIADATVTLHSSDDLESVATNDVGYFVFREVARTSGLILTVSAEGYEPVLVEFEPELSVDGTKKEVKDALNASVRMFPTKSANEVSHLKFPVGGWVYAQDKAAAGAKMALWRKPVIDSVTSAIVEGGYYVAETVTGDNGRFDFDPVVGGDYTLRVWPFDENKDGLMDFRLTDVDLTGLGSDTGTNTGRDSWSQVIRLEQPSETIVASSFGNVVYPVQPSQTSTAFANAVLRNGAGEIFMHFGAEVDTDLTRFELRKVTGAGQSTLVTPLDVKWDANYIARITPPAPFVADADATTKYELRLLSLRFRSGAHPISPDSGTAKGTITFAVHGAPSLLDNPTPAFHVATESNAAGQVATSARADAAGVWVLDQNNDVYGGSTQWTNGTGLTLSWGHVVGARSYVVYARNVFSESGRPGDHGPWRTATAALRMPADTYAPGGRVVASAVLQNEFASYGFQSAPWAHGNKVEFLVTSVNAAGFESPLDEGKTLVVKDDTAPTLTSTVVSAASSVERGAVIASAATLNLSEDVRASEFALVPVSGRVASVERLETTWTSAKTVQANVRVNLKQSCARLSVARTFSNETLDSDVFVPLDDPQALGSTSAALVFNPSGTFLGQLTGLTRAVGADYRYQMVVGDDTESFTATAGSQVCAVTSDNVASILSVSADEITVSDATLFAIGDTLHLFQPCVGDCSTAVTETRTVASIDTYANVVTVNGNVANTYDATAIAYVYASGVQQLRPSKTLALPYDQLGETLSIDEFYASGIYVGDTILVDPDGKTETVADQKVGQVTGIRIEDGRAQIATTLPGETTLVKGRATVTMLGDAFVVTGLKDTSNNPVAGTKNAFNSTGVWSVK